MNIRSKISGPGGAIGAALALTMAACGGGEAGAGARPARATASPSASSTTSPASARRTATFKGFDVEVAKYVAKELGYAEDKIDFKETPSAQRETADPGRPGALIFATYSITDARKEKVSFAGPYFIAGQDLLVAADNTDITGPDTMNGKKLCSVTGSTRRRRSRTSTPPRSSCSSRTPTASASRPWSAAPSTR